MTEPCIVCDQPITDNNWAWAAMKENGPVHTACHMTDDQLRAEFNKSTPCVGCTTVCEECKPENIDVLHYRDGIDNADIYSDGRIERLYGGIDQL